MKFALSALIVALHTAALRSFGSEVQFYGCQLISRLGVLFFFLASSYLLFSRRSVEPQERLSPNDIRRFVLRIARLYLFWLVANLPWIAYRRLYEPGLSILSVLHLIKNALFGSTFLGSWYLTSTIFSAVVIYLLHKKIPTKGILGITFAVYLFCALSSAYKGPIPDGFWTVVTRFFVAPYNSILTGLFYFAVGKWAAENRKRIELISRRLLWGLFSLFLAAAYGEILVLKATRILGETDCFLFLIPLSAVLFLLTLTSKATVKHAVVLRHVSTVTYCAHGTGLLVVNAALKIVGWDHSLLRFALVLSLCWLISAVILRLRNHPKFTWLRYAY